MKKVRCGMNKNIEDIIIWLKNHDYSLEYQSKLDILIDKYYDLKLNNSSEKDIGKWIAFKQEGMTPVLHGKIVRTINDVYKIHCKNGEYRFAKRKGARLFTSKEKCYKCKEL